MPQLPRRIAMVLDVLTRVAQTGASSAANECLNYMVGASSGSRVCLKGVLDKSGVSGVQRI